MLDNVNPMSINGIPSKLRLEKSRMLYSYQGNNCVNMKCQAYDVYFL